MLTHYQRLMLERSISNIRGRKGAQDEDVAFLAEYLPDLLECLEDAEAMVREMRQELTAIRKAVNGSEP